MRADADRPAARSPPKEPCVNLRTALYDCHVDAGARMVPFSGWDMPLHYGSQLQEHHRVRAEAGCSTFRT